jgi:centromeric protein E
MSSSPVTADSKGPVAGSPMPSVGFSATGPTVVQAPGSNPGLRERENSGASTVASAVNIMVGVRFRPFDTNEKRNNEKQAWDWDLKNKMITQKYSNACSKNNELLSFPVNHLFGPMHTTKDVYDGVVKDIVTSAMKGVNGTIFAYGQTSSGKTYT